jgi:hypothetical protein
MDENILNYFILRYMSWEFSLEYVYLKSFMMSGITIMEIEGRGYVSENCAQCSFVQQSAFSVIIVKFLVKYDNIDLGHNIYSFR